MKKSTAYFGLALLFTGGVLLGSAGTVMLLDRRVDRARKEGGPPVFQSKMAERTARELELSPDQLRAVSKIFRGSHAELTRLRRTQRAQVQQSLKKTKQELEQVLSPEQLAEFNEKMKRHSERMRRIQDVQRKRNQQKKQFPSPTPSSEPPPAKPIP